jgi:hypothetical protein
MTSCVERSPFRVDNVCFGLKLGENPCPGSESLADEFFHEMYCIHSFTCVMYEPSCDLFAWNFRPLLSS